jgi:hypothetical protein
MSLLIKSSKVVRSPLFRSATPPDDEPADPPTVLSATVNSAGTTLTVVFSRAVEAGAGGAGGAVYVPAAGADGTLTGTTTPTLTYATGDGFDTWTFTIGARTVNDSTVETATWNYTQPGDGIVAVDDAQEVATFTSAAVTNNSTQRGYRILQNFDTTSSIWGVGYILTANGLTAGWARSGSETMSETATPTGLEVFVSKSGGGDTPALPSQPVYGFYMSGAGAPDAFIGSGLSAPRDASADVPAKASPAWMRFTFTGIGSIASGTRVHLGITTQVVNDGSQNYIGWRTQTFGSGNLYGRAGDYPQASGDAANWVSTDSSGRGSHRILVSPQASGSP